MAMGQLFEEMRPGSAAIMSQMHLSIMWAQHNPQQIEELVHLSPEMMDSVSIAYLPLPP